MTRRTCLSLASLLFLVSVATFAKKKEKPALPDAILKAQSVLVVLQPEAREPLTDPSANRKALEEVEKALMKWHRFQFAPDATTADLIIAVRKGSGKTVTPTISGGPVDSRPVSVETTDSQIKIGVSQGRPPDLTQNPDPSPQDGRAHTGMEVSNVEDTFKVYLGRVDNPLDNAAVWSYVAKNALRPPDVTAVEEFRKAVEEAEKAAAQKQQQQQQAPQQKTP